MSASQISRAPCASLIMLLLGSCTDRCVVDETIAVRHRGRTHASGERTASPDPRTWGLSRPCRIEPATYIRAEYGSNRRARLESACPARNGVAGSVQRARLPQGVERSG